MKTKIISIVAVVLMLFAVAPVSAQINFEDGSWDEMLSKAAQEDKLIFVDAYAVWCGPCKWMDANVFPEKKVGAYYNEHFINYKFDMEKGEGPAFAKKYNVRNYPNYLYINANGEVVHSVMGSQPVDKFIEEGKKAVSKK